MQNIITIGSFDMFHYGHAKFLGAFMALPHNSAVIGVNTDSFIQICKGKAPVVPLAARVKLLKTLYPRARVEVYDGGLVLPWIKEMVPYFSDPHAQNTVVIGSDWQKKDYLSQLYLTHEAFFNAGLSLMYLPYTGGISTTLLREHV